MMPKRFRSDDGDEVNTMPVGGMRRNRAGLSSRGEMPVRPARPVKPVESLPEMPVLPARPVKSAKPVPSQIYTPAKPQGGTSTTGLTSIDGHLVPAFDPGSGGVTPMPVFGDPTSYGPAEPEPKRVVEGSSYPNTGATRMTNSVGYAKGGKVSSASKRADGIAQRGKTKGRML